MHIHFERNICTHADSNFLSLSWMGKVPDNLPEEGSGWKLNRTQYYVDGWLASGNTRGVVGVTFSTSHTHTYDAPHRSNFNLRGHRCEVMLVRWNEPYQKLATCDSRGIIFVWIKHEGRWSIELINDRNSQVTDFAWSHDGRMALICYKDGFILVGSVSGQRHWSSTVNLDNASITCGVWSPDDQQVLLGTTDGLVVVMNSVGNIVSKLAIHEGCEITSMAWSCERFNMDEVEMNVSGVDRRIKDDSPRCYILAACFKSGDIFLMTGSDDLCPAIVYTDLTDVKIDWSNCGKYLAVAGSVRLPNLQCRNELRLYSKDGSLICWANVPSQGKPLAALTWGHNDKRLFLAAGSQLHIARVTKHLSPLQSLCQQVVHQALHNAAAVHSLPIPQSLQCGIKTLFSPTVKSFIPDPLHLREFVCSSPPGAERLFCTIIRHGDEALSGHYTLYLEYLGGLVPLLKGKRASKLRPDFMIFDPKIRSFADQRQTAGAVESDPSSDSDQDIQHEGCASPRLQRRRRQKTFRTDRVNRNTTFRTLDELMFDDNLPETNRLAIVTSNIWGTKFQMIGVASTLPANLGQVVYKTSLLHLQPRQMTIKITEISPSHPVLYRDPNFTPAPQVSDDEDDLWDSDGEPVSDKPPPEVTVHETLSVRYSDGNYGQQRSGMDVGRRSVSVGRLPEHGDNSNSERKPNSAVRSRSMSPICSLLRQTLPDIKPDSNQRQTRQDTISKRARTKTHQKKQQDKQSDPPYQKSNDGLSYSSTSHNTNVNAYDRSDFGYSNPSTRLQYTEDNTVTTHIYPVITSIDKPESISPTSESYKRLENPPGTQFANSYNPRETDLCKISSEESCQTCSSTSTRTTLILLTDTSKVEVARWADPAAQALKHLETEISEPSDVPAENNLIADCIPTAPNYLDLHRRLYLEQQNIADSGTPVSPKNCPSCLSAKIAPSMKLDCSSSCRAFEASSGDDNTAYPVNSVSTPTCIPAVCVSPGGSRQQCQAAAVSHFSECPLSSEQINNISSTDSKQKKSSSARQGVAYLGGDIPSFVIPSNNHLSQQHRMCQHRNAETQQTKPDDLNRFHHFDASKQVNPSSQLPATQNHHHHHQISASSSNRKKSVPKVQHPCETQWNSSIPMYHLPPDTPNSTSTSTEDLLSVDRLHLILSEDPSFKNSTHNFQSMPGFFMQNPDHNKHRMSFSDRDIFESTNNQLPGLISVGDDFMDTLGLNTQLHHFSASVPSSPKRFGGKQNTLNYDDIPGSRCKHLSPLLGRKRQSFRPSSPDFFGFDSDRLSLKFQKSQLRQKVRQSLLDSSIYCESARTLTMHNKAPLWNETSQVYQLDFGGRVTQESAKNFQIDFRGRQVMQFGRIENNAYTLDFQHPFTAVQAFAVALANVTQRLK